MANNIDWEQARREMWSNREAANFGLLTVCSTCSPAVWCNCAYEQFHPSPEEMRTYRIEKLEREIARLRQRMETVQKPTPVTNTNKII